MGDSGARFIPQEEEEHLREILDLKCGLFEKMIFVVTTTSTRKGLLFPEARDCLLKIIQDLQFDINEKQLAKKLFCMTDDLCEEITNILLSGILSSMEEERDWLYASLPLMKHHISATEGAQPGNPIPDLDKLQNWNQEMNAMHLELGAILRKRGRMPQTTSNETLPSDVREKLIRMRKDGVIAFGVGSGQLTIFIDEDKLRANQDMLVHTIEGSLAGRFADFQIIEAKDSRLLNLSKSGSKLYPNPNDPSRYGTVGLVAESKDDLYMLTCSHVVPAGFFAYIPETGSNHLTASRFIKIGRCIASIERGEYQAHMDDVQQETGSKDSSAVGSAVEYDSGYGLSPVITGYDEDMDNSTSGISEGNGGTFVDISAIKVMAEHRSLCQCGLKNKEGYIVRSVGVYRDTNENLLGELVYKHGASTDLTEGTIVFPSITYIFSDGTPYELILIQPLKLDHCFSKGGDSGSVACIQGDETNDVTAVCMIATGWMEVKGYKNLVSAFRLDCGLDLLNESSDLELQLH